MKNFVDVLLAMKQNSPEYKAWTQAYLKLLAKSIGLEPRDTLGAFTDQPMWGTDSGRGRWESRARRWFQGHTYLYFKYYEHHHEGGDDGYRLIKHSAHYTPGYYDIPVFDSLAQRALNSLNLNTEKEQPKKEKQMNNKVKSTANTVLDTNKEAFQIATKLTAGKAANRFFLSKLVEKLPWYAKLFKKKEVQQNPFAKLATAEVASTLVAHFASDNEKLKYIADAMVQDAMLDITHSSNAVEKLLDELDSQITLPVNFNKTPGKE